MAEAHEPDPVKLICGILTAAPAVLDEAAGALAEAFGPVNLASETMDFDFTHYYDAEMGTPLRRRFVAFAEPVRPDALADAKRRTNAIERAFAARPDAPYPRPVNLDVGYLTPAKLVLASMKDFAHRVYLGGGVYAEVTLLRRGGAWRALPWTFPDYASGRYDAFLDAARRRLREQLRREGPT